MIDLNGKRTDLAKELIENGWALSDKRREARLQTLVRILNKDWKKTTDSLWQNMTFDNMKNSTFPTLQFLYYQKSISLVFSINESKEKVKSSRWSSTRRQKSRRVVAVWTSGNSAISPAARSEQVRNQAISGNGTFRLGVFLEIWNTLMQTLRRFSILFCLK